MDKNMIKYICSQGVVPPRKEIKKIEKLFENPLTNHKKYVIIYIQQIKGASHKGENKMFANHNFDHTIHATPSGRKVGIAKKTYGFMVYDDNGMIDNFRNYFEALKYVKSMA